MFLKKIRLQNIRSYTDGEISFKQGILLLSGDIGSGKSTILLSIEFALFGILRGDLSGSTLLRHGKTEGFVELHFKIDNKDVIIRRYLKKASTGIKQDAGHIIINDIKTDGTASELKTRILHLMGYPDELLTKSKAMIYRYTVYTPQELMKQILLDDKEDRLNTLRRVFGIDKYKRIVENASILTSKIKLDKKEIAGRIEDLDRKKNELSVHQKKAAELQKSIEAITSELNNLKLTVDSEKKKYSLIEQERNDFEKTRQEKIAFANEKSKKEREKEKLVGEELILKKEIAELKEEADAIIIELNIHDATTLDTQISEKRLEKERFISRRIELTQKIEYVQKEILAKKQSISKKEAELKNASEKKILSEQLLSKIKQKSEHEHKITSLEKEVEAVLGRLNGYELRRKELLDNTRNISTLEKCPLCQQDVSANHKHEIKSKTDASLDEMDAELKTLQPQKSEKTSLLTSLRLQFKDILDAENKLSALVVELKAIDHSRKEMVEEQELILKLSQKETDFKNELQNYPEEKIALFDQNIKKIESALEKIREQKVLSEKKKGMLAVASEKEKTIMASKERITSLVKEMEVITSELKIRDELLEKNRNIEQVYQQKKNELETLLLKEKDLDKKQSSCETELRMTQESATAVEIEIKNKELQRRRLEKLISMQTFLETDFINLMISMERHIMVNIHSEFTDLFKKWFSLLVEDDLLDARLDEDFSPVIIQNGYENDISNLSGGEKTAIALAYRLALNKVINDLISTIKTKDIIILDEPTDGFSEEQLDKIRDVLEELKMNQIILVSHESKIESFCDNVIRIVKRGHESAVL